MDLLGNLGLEDQLTAVRSENTVLQQRVKDLSVQVKSLLVENESLKAEVEMYRKEMALPNFSNLALGSNSNNPQQQPDQMMALENVDDSEMFVRAGNDEYPKRNDITFLQLHGPSNNLTCALSPDDVILASGGADGNLRLLPWGAADTAGNPNHSSTVAAQQVVNQAACVSCGAPVIAAAFASTVRNLLAVGCMDGSVALVSYGHATNNSASSSSSSLVTQQIPLVPKKHVKYVRNLAWSPKESILATGSADGSIYLYKVLEQKDQMVDDDDDYDNNNNNPSPAWEATVWESFHFSGPVEALCFLEHYLICYIRDTPHLTFIDLDHDMKQTKVNLNHAQPHQHPKSFATDHVSFAVLDLQPSPPSINNSTNGKYYLAAATDTSRNLILEVELPLHVSSSSSPAAVSCRILRNLYGHANDGFSQPKVAWSHNGQYLLGNTQDEAVICVWDIASQQIVQRLPANVTITNRDPHDLSHHHTSPIRDLCTGHSMNVLVSTAFDKSTRLWFAE